MGALEIANRIASQRLQGDADYQARVASKRALQDEAASELYKELQELAGAIVMVGNVRAQLEVSREPARVAIRAIEQIQFEVKDDPRNRFRYKRGTQQVAGWYAEGTAKGYATLRTGEPSQEHGQLEDAVKAIAESVGRVLLPGA